MALSAAVLRAQTFQIGQSTETVNDPVRSRSIPSEIFYPANQAGSNVAVAVGEFPLIVFGHGFSMNFNAYFNFINYFVPRGYIIALPKTEVGPVPFPDHGAFAADISYLVDYIQGQANNPNALFFQRVNGKSAVMGHSMGGGCSFIAAAQNPNIDVIATFAAAETNVSAIAAAQNISIPALVFSASEDNVSPAAGNQTDMYNNLASDCKHFINIEGGSHCGFANSNVACDFGETTVCLFCNFISRADQHARTFAVLEPWLDFHLLQQCTRWNDFNTALQTTTDVTALTNCTYTLPTVTVQAMGDSTFCEGDSLVLSTGSGLSKIWSTTDTGASVSIFNSGQYFLIVEDQFACRDTSRTITVSVNQAQALSFNLTDTTFCGTDSVELSLLGAFTSTTWNGQMLGNTIWVDQSQQYAVTANDVNGCVSRDTISLQLSQPDSSFFPIVSTIPSNKACVGDTIQINISDTLDGSLVWNNGATAATIDVTADGAYFLERTDSLGCTYYSDTVSVLFNDLPAVVLDTIGDSLFVNSTFATLNWLYNDSVVLSQFQNQTGIIADTSGFYSVLLTDTNGCSSLSDAYFIEIAEVVDTTMTDTTVTDTTVNTGNILVDKAIKVYPNPVEDRLNIEAYSNMQYQVYSVTGRSVDGGFISSGRNSISLHFLPSGIYYLTFFSEQDHYRLKLIKQ